MSGVQNVSVTSTNYNPAYSRNLVVSAKYSKINNTEQYVTEFFSINLIRLLRSTNLTSIGRLGSVPITTQANKLYSNTTCWWMIALLNGFGNPLAVDQTSIVGYPDITVLNNLTNISTGVSLNQSNVTI
jgi:hypothetical protein